MVMAIYLRTFDSFRELRSIGVAAFHLSCELLGLKSSRTVRAFYWSF